MSLKFLFFLVFSDHSSVTFAAILLVSDAILSAAVLGFLSSNVTSSARLLFVQTFFFTGALFVLKQCQLFLERMAYDCKTCRLIQQPSVNSSSFGNRVRNQILDKRQESMARFDVRLFFALFKYDLL